MLNLASLKAIFAFAPWVAILLLLGWGARVNDLRDRWHHQYADEHAARLSDRNSYEQAQRDAKITNQNQVSRVKAEQEKINEDVATKYERDLARLRAGNVRNGPAPSGSASHPGSPDASKAPSGIGGQVVPLPGPELLRAQEIELQLNALIDWANGQSQIDPNQR